MYLIYRQVMKWRFLAEQDMFSPIDCASFMQVLLFVRTCICSDFETFLSKIALD